MRRRQVLAALPTAAIASCLSGPGDVDGPSSPADRTPPDGIELVEFTHPEHVRAGRESRLGAVVRNGADAERAGSLALELSPAGEDWRRLVETEYELGPGEQEIVETTVTTHFVGSLRLRLVPFDGTARVDSTDPSFPYGGTYALPNGVDLTVGEMRPIDGYEYEADGERRRATPQDDVHWHLVPVTAANRGEEVAIAPYRTSFETLGYDWRTAVRYRGEDAYEGGELRPGTSRSGGVLFETRHRSDEKGVRLRQPYEGGTVGATWTPH